MRRLIPLLLASALALPGIAAASNSTSRQSSTRWALFGLGGKHTNKSAKTAKAPKTAKTPKAKRAKRSK